MNARRLILLALFATACGTATGTSDKLSKADAQALIGSGDADDAVCSENGFNDDDECDDWCPDGDQADCAVSNACADGDAKDADDGCNTCSCIDGGWACTEIACNVEPNNANNAPQLLPLEMGDCPTGGDALAINSVWVKGDTLSVDASFSGGCAEHTVTACWDGSFLESNPVQAHISLYHDAHGDSCEAYLTQTFTFDLTSMKDVYNAGYPGTPGTVLLAVDGEGTRYDF